MTAGLDAAVLLGALDPAVAMQAADRIQRDTAGTNVLNGAGMDIEMLTPDCTASLGTIGDYTSATAQWKRNDVDTATIVLKGSDPLGPVARKCRDTVRPITIRANDMKWTGRVDTCEKALSNGEWTYTLQCLGDYNWFNKIFVWPNWALPIEIQEPKEAVYIGPEITCLKVMIAEQLIRLQLGIWDWADNLLNPMAWFAAALEEEGLLTPCAVVPTNPLFDTSRWVAVKARMDSVATMLQQICKDDGLLASAVLWEPGDPQPTNWYTLTEPTIVMDIKDRSGITGPTGTFIDGLITSVLDLQSSELGNVLAPLLNPNNLYHPEGVNIAPILGVNFVPPWVIYDADNPRSGIVEAHIVDHHPLAYTVLQGGKSPQWINNLINATLEFVMSAGMIALGITGIPDNLFDGSLDDVVLAFMQEENTNRRFALGKFGYPEYFTGSGSSSYTLEAWFAMEIAMWDTRGYTSAQITTMDGYPYRFGRDVFVGSLASVVSDGQLATNYVDSVTLNDDRSNRIKMTAQIGDGAAEESPLAKLQRRLSNFQKAFQTMMLSSN